MRIRALLMTRFAWTCFPDEDESFAMHSRLTTILVPPVEERHLLADLVDIRLVTYTPGDELPAGATEATILVTGRARPAALDPVIAQLPRLRMIQTLNAGVDQWAGHVPAGVFLSNARGAHGAATAEWAATALLSVFRNFPHYVLGQQQHSWESARSESMVGKRVLVIGAGDLATQLERRLVAFDAIVTLVGRTARGGVHGIEELPELLPQHDAVVLMVPLGDATRHLVNAGFLALMPDHAVLVNAARGPVVETGALLAELQRGRLRAALDVTDPEPLPPDHPLWSAPGLFLTPHIGGNTTGSDERAWRVVRRQIAQFLRGEQPANTIDPG